MKAMKMKMGSRKSNVDPGIKENNRGQESIEQGHSEHSEGVIPPSMLRKHGLEIGMPKETAGDPKKQANVSDADDSDIFP